MKNIAQSKYMVTQHLLPISARHDLFQLAGSPWMGRAHSSYFSSYNKYISLSSLLFSISLRDYTQWISSYVSCTDDELGAAIRRVFFRYIRSLFKIKTKPSNWTSLTIPIESMMRVWYAERTCSCSFPLNFCPSLSRLPHQLDSNSRIFILFLQCSVSPTSLSPRLLCEHAYALSSGSVSTIIYEPRKKEWTRKTVQHMSMELLSRTRRKESNFIES